MNGFLGRRREGERRLDWRERAVGVCWRDAIDGEFEALSVFVFVFVFVREGVSAERRLDWVKREKEGGD
ncbi:hypothetical protein Pint_07795 [Pistacia integerrima]|uniref:Uncharacterized protein n=1 Tax=Pistacia integerrima TaxID=434235 RepID=A0ACC0XRV7_9ROSI|nr:hypothetical protein Pint_07795 [Pistacia integerrima]